MGAADFTHSPPKASKAFCAVEWCAQPPRIDSSVQGLGKGEELRP